MFVGILTDKNSVPRRAVSAAGIFGGSRSTSPINPAAELLLPPSPPPDATKPSAGTEASVHNRVRTDDSVVFVTIDDGYVRDPRVVEFIERTRMPVSLFLVDTVMKPGLESFSRLQAAGATIEDHTFNHPVLPSLNFGSQMTQICRPAQDIARLFSHAPTLFRPPYGSYDLSTRRAAKACGFDALVTWSGSMNGGNLALARGKIEKGDIILMHFRPDLFENLNNLSNLLAKKGLHVARLEDYLKAPEASGIVGQIPSFERSASPSGSPSPKGPQPSPSPQPSETASPSPSAKPSPKPSASSEPTSPAPLISPAV